MGGINRPDIKVQIEAELKLYSQGVTQKIKDITKEIANETVAELRAASPKRTGKYAKAWKIKEMFESANVIRFVIHNSKPGIPHLLEYGHTKRGGGFVAAKPHIRAVEKKAIEKYQKKVQEAIKNG